MHEVAVGSVMQSFNVCTSAFSVLHVLSSHFEESALGRLVLSPYFDVQAVDVGSCKHAFKDINVEAIPSLPVALAGQSEEVISPKQFSKEFILAVLDVVAVDKVETSDLRFSTSD